LEAPTARDGIALPGDVNGIYWDANDHALYLADSTHGDVLRWTDHDGFTPIAQLPGDKLELAGIVRQPDGTFVVVSFEFGTSGGVLVVDPQHRVAAVPNLDPARRRIGLARASDGTLYDAYFVVDSGKTHHGGVAKLDLATGETDVVTAGLAKAV